MWHNPRKPIKKIGREGQRYIEFRNDIAYPHLVEKFGEKCSKCGRSDLPLDVDHLKNRGSHIELKYTLSNLALLCRSCHIKKSS